MRTTDPIAEPPGPPACPTPLSTLFAAVHHLTMGRNRAARERWLAAFLAVAPHRRGDIVPALRGCQLGLLEKFYAHHHATAGEMDRGLFETLLDLLRRDLTGSPAPRFEWWRLRAVAMAEHHKANRTGNAQVAHWMALILMAAERDLPHLGRIAHATKARSAPQLAGWAERDAATGGWWVAVVDNTLADLRAVLAALPLDAAPADEWTEDGFAADPRKLAGADEFVPLDDDDDPYADQINRLRTALDRNPGW